MVIQQWPDIHHYQFKKKKDSLQGAHFTPRLSLFPKQYVGEEKSSFKSKYVLFAIAVGVSQQG